LQNLLPFLLFYLAVEIEPPSIVVSPGDSAIVNIKVLKDSKVIKPDRVDWEVIPPHIATIRDGVLRGKREGIGVVRAKVKALGEEKVVHAYLEVKRKKKIRIELFPKKVLLEPGEEVLFKAVLIGEEGRKERLSLLKYKVIPSWIGSINKKGKFKAGSKKGVGEVVGIAEIEGEKYMASSKVFVGLEKENIHKVRLFPRFIILTPGEQVFFTPEDGIEFEDAEIEYWVTPHSIGEISEDGLFTARETGRGEVWVSFKRGGEIGIGKALVVIRPYEKVPRIEPPFLVLRKDEEASLRILGRIPPPLGRRIKVESVPPSLIEIERDGKRIKVKGRSKGVGFIKFSIGERGRKIEERIPIIVGERKLKLIPERAAVRIGERIRVQVKGDGQNPVKYHFIVRPPFAGRIEGDYFIPTGEARKAYILAIVDEKGGGGGISLIKILPRRPLRFPK